MMYNEIFQKKSRLTKLFVKLFNINPNNSYLVSFPRTGSHWLRMLIELYFERPLLVRSFFFPRKYNFLLLHTHDLDYQLKRRKVIYLYRNPYETIYSQLRYHHEDIANLSTIAYWTKSYAAHLEKWLLNEDFTHKKTIITYDGLQKDLVEEFRKITSHFNQKLDKQRILTISEEVSKEKVKKFTPHDSAVIVTSPDYQNNRSIFITTHAVYIDSLIFSYNPELMKLFPKDI